MIFVLPATHLKVLNALQSLDRFDLGNPVVNYSASLQWM